MQKIQGRTIHVVGLYNSCFLKISLLQHLLYLTSRRKGYQNGLLDGNRLLKFIQLFSYITYRYHCVPEHLPRVALVQVKHQCKKNKCSANVGDSSSQRNPNRYLQQELRNQPYQTSIVGKEQPVHTPYSKKGFIIFFEGQHLEIYLTIFQDISLHRIYI